VKAQNISENDLYKYMNNDFELSYKWGLDRSLFQRNQSFIDEDSVLYEVVESNHPFNGEMTLYNPCGLKLRVDKILSEILQLSRSEIKRLMKSACLYSKDKYIRDGTNVRLETNIF
jgi:hypothetical protein